jgi:hypothetical protein
LRSAIWKIYSASRNSWGGRGLFLWHLLFTIVIFRHYEISFPSLPVLAFILANAPQFIILRLVGGPPLTTPWTFAFAGLFISIPWWAYGVAAEFAVRRYLEQKIGNRETHPFSFVKKSF